MSVVEIETLMPNRTTISRNLQKATEKSISEFSPKLLKLIRNQGGSFAIDYGKRLKDYLAVVLYFFDSDWYIFNTLIHKIMKIFIIFRSYKSILIGMMRVGREKKTADNIWSHIIQSVEAFGIVEDDLINLHSCSDEGANVVAALDLFNFKSNIFNNIIKFIL